MKKKFTILYLSPILIIISVVTFWFVFSSQSNSFSNAPLTTLKIVKDSINLKTIHYDEHPQITFTLKNTGSHPLFIKDVLTTCGCIKPQWEKRPVLPGQTREIIFNFKPNSLGFFHKTIHVLCNTETKLHALKLKGFVIE